MCASQEKKKKKNMEQEQEKNVQNKFPLVLIKIQQCNNTPPAFLFFPLFSVCSNSHRLALLPPRTPPWTVHDHFDEFIKLAAFLIEMGQWRKQEGR